MLVGVALGGASVARADQFVLLDKTYTHTEMNSHHREVTNPAKPADISTPVDYRDGSIHYRLEVFSMASDTDWKMQVIFEQPATGADGSYLCGSYQLVTAPGVYEWDLTMANLKFVCADGEYMYNHPPDKLAMIIRDAAASPKKIDNGQGYIGEPNQALYLPYQARITVTLVSNGATYIPPVVEMDAGMDATAPPADSSVPDATTDSPDAATSVDGAVSTPDGGTNTADASIDNGKISGSCALGTPRARSPYPALIVGIGLMLAVRRRRSLRRLKARQE